MTYLLAPKYDATCHGNMTIYVKHSNCSSMHYTLDMQTHITDRKKGSYVLLPMSKITLFLDQIVLIGV